MTILAAFFARDATTIVMMIEQMKKKQTRLKKKKKNNPRFFQRPQRKSRMKKAKSRRCFTSGANPSSTQSEAVALEKEQEKYIASFLLRSRTRQLRALFTSSFECANKRGRQQLSQSNRDNYTSDSSIARQFELRGHKKVQELEDKYTTGISANVFVLKQRTRRVSYGLY